MRDAARRSGGKGLVWFGATVGVVAAAFLGDTLSGSEASFSFFYLIAIALGTWYAGLGWGLVLSVLSAAGWTGAYFLTGQLYSNRNVLYWNVGFQLIIFVGVSLVLARVRTGVDRERSLQLELERAYERLDREMRSVGELQRSLLPAAVPALPGYAMAVHYAPSTRAGGDAYDFLELPEGRVAIWVADASGHGAPAAVLMAMTRVLLHAAPGSSPEAHPFTRPERVLAMLNLQVRRAIPNEHFVTACLAVLELGSGRVDYALAGHPPPLRLRASGGGADALTCRDGLPLGAFENARFESNATRLGRGDTLVFYTDGLTEALDAEGRMFGEERLRRVLEKHRRLAPDELRDRVLAELAAHAGGAPASDDVTLLVLRATGPGGGR